MDKNKEFLYVGHYIDKEGNYILKIGTTNDLKRRASEHTRHYRKSPNYTLPQGERFVYDWYHKLSKYNTLRFEDSNRERWKEMGIGEFVRNDRFRCDRRPSKISIKIRKEYFIELG